MTSPTRKNKKKPQMVALKDRSVSPTFTSNEVFYGTDTVQKTDERYLTEAKRMHGMRQANQY